MTKNRMVDRRNHRKSIPTMLPTDCRWCDRERKTDGLTLGEVVTPLLWATWETQRVNACVWASGNTDWIV